MRGRCQDHVSPKVITGRHVVSQPREAVDQGRAHGTALLTWAIVVEIAATCQAAK
jgi:hypothetical protein